ncbi:hypothetical protein N8787_02960 [Opitutaceae bacterium]|nr:hypothetical protein [Opitutaceae bacterium]
MPISKFFKKPYLRTSHLAEPEIRRQAFTPFAAVFLVSLLAGLAPSRAGAQTTYRLLEIDETRTMTGWVEAINESGQAVGSVRNEQGQNSAFIWDIENGIQLIGDLGGSWSEALGVNDFGQVVGLANPSSSRYSRAFLWDPESGTIDLGTLGGSQSIAWGINNVGQVVGWSIDSLGKQRAFIWDAANGMRELGLPANLGSRALAINDSGQITGQVSLNSPAGTAFLLDPSNGFQDIGNLGGSYAYPYAINSIGQISGFSNTGSGTGAFLWDESTGMQDLGDLGGGVNYGSRNNDSGVVVGQARTETGNYHGFVWNDVEGMIDLNDVTEGLEESAYIQWASDINNSGIIGGDFRDGSGQYRPMVLVPNDNTPVGSNVPVTPIPVDENGDPVFDAPTVDISFQEVTGGGETTVTVTEQGPPPPIGLKLGNPPIYLDIETDAAFDGEIEICIDYSTMTFAGDIGKLELWHNGSGGWVKITTNNDEAAKVICGKTTSLSPFAILESKDPVELLGDLAADVSELNANKGIINSLDKKLEHVEAALTDAKQNNDYSAINVLMYAFMNAVNAQRGGHLSESEADNLILRAEEIVLVLVKNTEP